METVPLTDDELIAVTYKNSGDSKGLSGAFLPANDFKMRTELR